METELSHVIEVFHFGERLGFLCFSFLQKKQSKQVLFKCLHKKITYLV